MSALPPIADTNSYRLECQLCANRRPSQFLNNHGNVALSDSTICLIGDDVRQAVSPVGAVDIFDDFLRCSTPGNRFLTHPYDLMFMMSQKTSIGQDNKSVLQELMLETTRNYGLIG